MTILHTLSQKEAEAQDLVDHLWAWVGCTEGAFTIKILTTISLSTHTPGLLVPAKLLEDPIQQEDPLEALWMQNRVSKKISILVTSPPLHHLQLQQNLY